MGSYRLRLAKPDFKFAVAHFTRFEDAAAERLHGHDYRVLVEVEGDTVGADGLLIEISRVKQHIRAFCARLDEHVLLPSPSDQVSIARSGGSVEVGVGDRRYVLPDGDVIELPITNVCMEQLALHLWRELAPTLAGTRVRELAVEVEESPGQSCRYRARL